MSRLALVVLGLGGAACGVGEGEGWVRSDRLYIEDCWSGALDLRPDFFAANPAPPSDSLTIRVQNGDNLEEQSDGVVVVVSRLSEVRRRVGENVAVGLPPGVSPPGIPLELVEDPPMVSIALFLHNSCHAQNGTVYSIGGNIRFESLYSGDPNEDQASDRLTEGRFDATFADPRNLVGEEGDDPQLRSRVEGYFRFFYQRGQPAQPFQ